MAASNTKLLCSKCQKAAGIFNCNGCQQSFCGKHVGEHRQELSKEYDTLVNQHDLLQQAFASSPNRSSNSKSNVLFNEINVWECESIKKIQIVAEKARKNVEEILNKNSTQFTADLKKVTIQMQNGKEADDYTEIDLNQWMNQLDNLKKQLNISPTNIELRYSNALTNISFVEVINNLHSIEPLIQAGAAAVAEKFTHVSGNITLESNGLVAVRRGAQCSHSSCCGVNSYSTGRSHRVQIRIEKMRAGNGWLFIGVVSNSAKLLNQSYTTTSAHGWSIGQGSLNRYYINAKVTVEPSKFVGTDFHEGDIIELIINPDQRMIVLVNNRTKQESDIIIDLNQCAFPWQLYVGMHYSGDSLRIVSNDNR